MTLSNKTIQPPTINPPMLLKPTKRLTIKKSTPNNSGSIHGLR